MAMKAGMISGEDGVLGAHTALDHLQDANPKAVIFVGRDAEKPRAFTAGLGEGEPRCPYHWKHEVDAQDLGFGLLHPERPQTVISSADLAKHVAALCDGPSTS